MTEPEVDYKALYHEERDRMRRLQEAHAEDIDKLKCDHNTQLRYWTNRASKLETELNKRFARLAVLEAQQKAMGDLSSLKPIVVNTVFDEWENRTPEEDLRPRLFYERARRMEVEEELQAVKEALESAFAAICAIPGVQEYQRFVAQKDWKFDGGPSKTFWSYLERDKTASGSSPHRRVQKYFKQIAPTGKETT